MSEEQTQSEVDVEQVETPAVEETTTEPSDTATDEQAQETPDYQKIIAEKAFETRQAQREKKELERQLEEMQATAPQEQRPDLPAMPDPYDDDFESKLRSRDQAVIAQTQFDERARLQQEQAQQAQVQQQQDAYNARVTKVAEYSKRATALGVEAKELEEAGGRVQHYVNEDVTEYILSSDKGPLITKYLGANPLELDTLSRMNSMQAAVYLETQVKGKAEKFGQKQTSNAPEPVEPIGGSGAAPSRGPKGAKFE